MRDPMRAQEERSEDEEETHEYRRTLDHVPVGDKRHERIELT